MSLEFNQIINSIHKMVYYREKLEQSMINKLELALQRFRAAPPLAAVHERVMLARRPDVSGYRGAAPLDPQLAEPVNHTFPAAPPPARAVALAADGSQIYPDYHSPTLYYLINIGMFAYFHGEDRLPQQWIQPEMVYTESLLKDASNQLISGRTVNNRRTVEEMRALGSKAWELRHAGEQTLVAIHDGNLLKFFGGVDVEDSGGLEKAYVSALVHLYDSGSLLCGYVDDPRSQYVISLLHLLSLEEHQVNDLYLQNDGDLEGLRDLALFSHVLKPGERSALMAANSPQNRDYRKEYGVSYEIAFFYVNVAPQGRPVIARVDVPMWVARDKAAINTIHGLLLAQCAIQGRRAYPYALTRADELAVIGGGEKRQLDELIRVVMRDRGLEPARESNKMESKDLARGMQRQEFRLGGQT